MDKRVLERLRKSFRQLTDDGHLPKVDRRVIASSDAGLVITAFDGQKARTNVTAGGAVTGAAPVTASTN